MNRVILQGQTFFDKVLELTGDVTNALAMAALNNVSITDIPDIGTPIAPTSITQSIYNIFIASPPASVAADADVVNNGLPNVTLAPSNKKRDQRAMLRGQTLFDKTIELTGDITNALAIAALNNVSLTGSLNIDDIINPAGIYDNSVVALFYTMPPATSTKGDSVHAYEYLLPQTFPFL